MRLKASAYKQYGDAAVLSLVLETLPKVAAEVSAPLAKTDEIVILGTRLCSNDATVIVRFHQTKHASRCRRRPRDVRSVAVVGGNASCRAGAHRSRPLRGKMAPFLLQSLQQNLLVSLL